MRCSVQVCRRRMDANRSPLRTENRELGLDLRRCPVTSTSPTPPSKRSSVTPVLIFWCQVADNSSGAWRRPARAPGPSRHACPTTAAIGFASSAPGPATVSSLYRPSSDRSSPGRQRHPDAAGNHRPEPQRVLRPDPHSSGGQHPDTSDSLARRLPRGHSRNGRHAPPPVRKRNHVPGIRSRRRTATRQISRRHHRRVVCVARTLLSA